MALWFTITKNDTTSAEFNNPTIDGQISGDPTTNAYSWVTDGTTIKAQYLSSYRRCPVVEWDISELGSLATCTRVTLKYHCWSAGTDCWVKAYTAARPSTESSLSIIWSRATTGAKYYNTPTWPVYGPNKAVTLSTSGGTACTDVVAQSIYGWFALSIDRKNTTDVTDAGIFVAEDWAASTPPPTLYIEYSMSTSIKISMPDNVRKISRRNTESYLFKDGTFKRQDIGSAGKEVIMSGHEWMSTSEASLAFIDTMTGGGGKVTLSGLDESSLNDEWFLVDFTWNKGPGYVNRYDWQLHLLEAP